MFENEMFKTEFSILLGSFPNKSKIFQIDFSCTMRSMKTTFRGHFDGKARVFFFFFFFFFCFVFVLFLKEIVHTHNKGSRASRL